MGQMLDIYDHEYEDIMQVTGVHVAYLAKAMTAKLLSRMEKNNKKAALVFVGSGLGARPVPGVTVYSACKSFGSFLTSALSVEFSGKVDCMHYEVGEMSTKMRRAPPGGMIITPEKASAACLRDIGIETHTNGSFIHEMSTTMMNGLPLGAMQSLMNFVSVKALKKRREEETNTNKRD